MDPVLVEGLRVFQPFTSKEETLPDGRDARFVLNMVFQGSCIRRGEHRDGVSSPSLLYNVDGYGSCRIVCSESVKAGGQGENDARRT